jgi:hypothetical protein
MIKVKTVKPNNEYHLELLFDNGEVRCFDMRPYLDKGIFSELKDLEYFNQVFVHFGSIAWKNGQDLSPDTLYLKSITVVQRL